MGRGKQVESGASGAGDGAEATALEAPAQASAPTPKRRASRLPPAVQFPLVVVLSLSLSSLGYSLLNAWSRAGIASIARQSEMNSELALLTAWRIFELALGWYGDFDSYDLAALNLLSHGPSLFLQVAFYDIDLWTGGACLALDTLSGSVPFLLLRPTSGAHSASSSSPPVPNREIILDRGIQTSTAVLSGLIYGTTLFAAFKTYLPTIFVLYFEGIARVEPAVHTKFGSLLAGVLMLLFGLAAQGFIFAPFATTGRTRADAKIAEFDPISATLGETLWWNVWGYTTRTKVAIVRTAAVMFVTWVSTYLQCAMTIKGVESYGAAVYASSWALAAMLTGLGLEVVGDV